MNTQTASQTFQVNDFRNEIKLKLNPYFKPDRFNYFEPKYNRILEECKSPGSLSQEYVPYFKTLRGFMRYYNAEVQVIADRSWNGAHFRMLLAKLNNLRAFYENEYGI